MTEDPDNRRLIGATGRVQVSASHTALWAILDEWAMTELIALATIPRPGTKTTSRKAGLLLAKMAAEHLAENRPLPDPLRDYLVNALQATADEKNLARAWHVCGIRNATDPADKLANDMEINRALVRYRKQLGSMGKAVDAVCAEFGISDRQAWDIWKGVPEHIKALFY